MNIVREEIDLIDLQIMGSILFIGILILSISLNYDQKMQLTDGKRLFTDEEADFLVVCNKIITLLVILLFSYTSFESYNVAKEKKQNLKPFEIINFASILNVISAILIVYATILGIQNDEIIPGLENPIS